MSLASLDELELDLTSPGDQRPRIENTPLAFGTFGPKVIDFAAACGVSLDDWQQYVITGLFAVLEDGRWASSEFGLLVSRQNGKGEILVAYDLAHLFLFPRPDNRRKTVLHTAHEVKTAVDGFQRLTGVIESKGKLMDRVEDRGIRVGNGQEGITLKKRDGQLNGDRCRFIARTRSSGRGFAGDVNVYDEAQEFSSSKRDALTYTQTTSPNRQEVYTGTVPGDENDPEVFEGVRDRGRSHSGARTGWMEWSPAGAESPKAILRHPKTPVTDPLVDLGRVIIDLSSRVAQRAANPAVNIRAFNFERIDEEVERATDIEALARERFSVWPDKADEVAESANDLDLEVWDRVGDDKVRFKPSTPTGELVPESIAVALGRAGQFATIALGARFDVEHVAVAHHDTRKGTLWVAAEIAELKATYPDALVVLDGKNAASILTSLDTVGVKYMALNLNELAASQASFIEWSNAGLVLHPPQAEVRKSLESAVPRAIGQTGFTWDASDPTKPVSHAQAVTWAMFGVQKLEAAPPKPPAVVKGYA